MSDHTDDTPRYTQADLDRVFDAALEAAARATEILPEMGNAGPPQDNTDRLLDAQRRHDARAIRALKSNTALRVRITKGTTNGNS